MDAQPCPPDVAVTFFQGFVEEILIIQLSSTTASSRVKLSLLYLMWQTLQGLLDCSVCSDGIIHRMWNDDSLSNASNIRAGRRADPMDPLCFFSAVPCTDGASTYSSPSLPLLFLHAQVADLVLWLAGAAAQVRGPAAHSGRPRCRRRHMAYRSTAPWPKSNAVSAVAMSVVAATATLVS